MVQKVMKKTELYLNYAGHCFAKEHHAIRGGKREDITFHALWGLIKHPEKGFVLFDTGYTSRFFQATKRYPHKIYAKATKVVINNEDEIANQLAAQGIDPLSIEHVLITHFHADHTAGMRDFPNAKFYCTKDALDQALSLPHVISFSKGILKKLLPEDLKNRCVLVDQSCESTSDPILGTKYDIFGDQSMFAIMLPGHAKGQMGIQLQTEKSQYLLIADACWLRKSYEEYVLPHPIVRLFFHSWKDFKSSLRKVHKYHIQNPNLVIVPTHCSSTTDPLISKKIDWNAL